MDTSIHIDGGTFEGGGQLVRNAVSFSALLSKPVTISDIRKNRKESGLKPQHTTGLQLLEKICAAYTKGIDKGSTTISFMSEHPAKCGQYTADTGTAGSTALLLQVSLPSLLFASPSEDVKVGGVSHLTLRGGTNATAAPQIDYTQHVFLPFLRSHFGIDIQLDVRRRGYWPKGGGEVAVSIPSISNSILPLDLTARGPVTSVLGKAFVTGSLPSNIADLMVQAAKTVLTAGGIDKKMIDIKIFKDNDAIGSGSGIVLWAQTAGGCIIGGSAVGVKGTNATNTGRQAGEELVRNLSHGGCVDEYLQDQIIIFMALAKGISRVSVGPMTMHTKTAIWLAETLTSACFDFEKESDVTHGILSCRGIGLSTSRGNDIVL